MIGLDMEKIARFEHWNEEGFQRVFTENEIEYAKSFVNSLEHFAGFWCVKEAFVKALNDDSVTYTNIEVLHDEDGKPYINMNTYIKNLLKEHFACKIEISISHMSDMAAAVVLVE